MSFNLSKFQNSNFQARTADVPVPALKDFFGKDDEPVWKVRGLSGEALARVHEAQSKNKSMDALVQALVASNAEDKIEAIRDSLGIGCSVPEDMAKRLEMLVRGSVEPEVDQAAAVKLAEAFPIEFYQITNKITELTGQGSQPGKQKPSTVTRKSK